MFNSLKSLLGKPVKAVNSVNPMADIMKNLEAAKVNNLVNEDASEARYNELIKMGKSYLKKFSLSKMKIEELTMLEKAATTFTDALNIKKNRPEPYFYLAHIFILLNEVTLALKYIKVLSFIDPEFSGLEDLKKTISNYGLIRDKENNQKTNTNQVAKKPAVTSVSYKEFLKPARTLNKLSMV